MEVVFGLSSAALCINALATQLLGQRLVWYPITRLGDLFYHDVGEISDHSQSEALNLVMWRVRVMQPTTPSLGNEGVVGSSLMFRKMDLWNIIRKYTAEQD